MLTRNEKHPHVDFIVQASSRSWSGGADLCMSPVDGHPVVGWTLRKITESFPDSRIVIAAPSFDEQGELQEVARTVDPGIDVFFGNDANPLERLIGAHQRVSLSRHFCRIDGLNMFFLESVVRTMIGAAVDQDLDCIKFPDSFPPQLSADVYKLDALIELARTLDTNSPYVVHPKYALFEDGRFRTAFVKIEPPPADDYLRLARHTYRTVYSAPRDEVNDKGIRIGDMLTFHYQLALPWIRSSDLVLDIACGAGFGSAMLANVAHGVCGADISGEVVARAQERRRQHENLSFVVSDVTRMGFPANHFDVVTSFETIEHVDPERCLRELHRVLRPEGLLIISTPQNSIGHIPLNPQHIHEFSFEGIKSLVSERFEIANWQVIKQGRVVNQSDTAGTNTVLVARKVG